MSDPDHPRLLMAGFRQQCRAKHRGELWRSKMVGLFVSGDCWDGGRRFHAEEFRWRGSRRAEMLTRCCTYLIRIDV